jgi:putative endonuclease
MIVFLATKDAKDAKNTKYCYKLIYYERSVDVNQAIRREKEIKDLSRQKKEELITTMNPNWNFLRI